MLYVTTSWDDGSVYDLLLASLLEKYGAKGTFYVARELPPKYQDKKLLSGTEIRELALTGEVGAHTLSHQDLTTITEEQALHEMKGSKEWLEQIIGREVAMFCYPFGFYNASVVALAQRAGFKGARTTEAGYIETPHNPYEMHTTMQVSPFPFRKTDAKRYYWREFFKPLQYHYKTYRSVGVPLFAMTSWLRAAKAAFDYAYRSGEVFHLWGHSWELERYGMWGEVEELLRYIATHDNVTFVTNSELLEVATQQR